MAALVVLVLLALGVAMSDFGNDKIRGLALEAVNKSIYGELSAQKLSFKGGHIVLQGVELKDPDGERVAAVQKVELVVELGALLSKTVHVESVLVEKPELYLVQEDGTSNLQRAIGPRHPKPKEENPKKQGGPSILVDKVALRDGTVEVEQRSPEGTKSYQLSELTADGSVIARNGGEGELDARLQLGALMAEPLEGALAVNVTARGEGEVREVRVTVKAPGTDAAVVAKTLNETDADVLIEKLTVEPSTLRALVPSYPLIAPISAEGELHKRGTAVTARLGAKAASSKLSLDAAADTATKRISKLSLRLSDVDLAQLVEGGPKSDVSLSLEGSGGGTSAEDAHGVVALSAPPSTMDGHPFGPVDVRLKVSSGAVDIEKFVAKLPGLELHADGTVGREALDVELDVAAKDLGAFSRTIGTLAGPGKVDLGGAGSVKITAKGATTDPAVTLEASFPELRVRQQRLRGFSAHAVLPHAKDPLSLDASVQARRLILPAMNITDLAFQMRTEGRSLRVDARARGLTVLSFTLESVLDSDRKGMDLRRLTLSYPEATWSLAAPSRIRFDGDELSARKLQLVSGDQSILVDGKKRGEDLDGRLSVRRLNLATLPQLVIDPGMGLGGQLSVEVDASGTTRAPELKGHLALRNGSYRELKDLELSVDGLYRRDRVTGNATANGVGTKLDAEYDVPITALKTRRPQPIRVIAKVDELDFDRLAQSGFKLPVRGFVAGSLEIKGLASDPRLDVEVTARDLKYEQLPPTSGKLVAKSGDGGRLFARIDVEMLDKRGFAELRTPWSLGRLMSRPPTRGEAMRAPIRLRADFKDFPLPIPYTADVIDQLVTGTLTVDADVKGSLLRPDGRFKARLAGISRGRSPVIEAGIDAVAKADGIRVSVDAVRQSDKQKLIDLVAVMNAPPSKLANPDALERLPIKLDGTVGPVGVSELQSLLTPPRRAGTSIGVRYEQPPLNGTLTARLEGSGTLGDPKIVVRSRIEQLGSPDVQPGDLTFSYDYDDAQHDLALVMKGPTGGELKLTAAAEADIGLRAMRKGFDATALDFAADVEAKDFDPQFLSGSTPKLRRLGGRIDANAKVSGTPTQPNVNGRLEWREGLLSIAGSGRYEEVHLLVEGNNERVEIKELFARAAEGEAKLYALAEDGGDHFTLKANVEMKEFPIVSLDQLAATVTTRAAIEGVATRTLLDVHRLHISEATVLLPDVKRKNLQQLDIPKDVVFTKRGKPVVDTAEERKKKEREQAGVGGSAQPTDFEVKAKVFAPRNIWLKGKDLSAEVGFEEGFNVHIAGKPMLFGNVVVHRGRVSVFGRRFDLERDSKVAFSGPPAAPRLDVTAIHNNEREQVKVFLAVSGPANKVEIKPTSEPPLTETEIYTLIATGRRSLRPGSGGAANEGGGAASVVGSFAAGQLKKTLSNKLPLDVLSIEAGDEGLEGAKVEAGTYVNDKLYLGFTGRVGANPNRGENSNAVRLEYQLSRRWSFQAEYGDAKAGGADLIWSKEY